MAPVPVYTDSPLASKPSGVTPQTQDAPPPAGQAPGPTTTSSVGPPAGYPPAQPGAAPSLPAATGVAAPGGAQQQISPTPTQTIGTAGPPPPQPGAVPTVPTAARSPLPPPPKVGEKFVPPPPSSSQQATTTAMPPYPPQMGIPPPTMTYPAQQTGTYTPVAAAYAPQAAATSSSAAPAGQGHPSLQHPPGYQQDAHAHGLDMYQRNTLLQNDTHRQQDEPEEGVWNTAKKWAQATGEKLAAAETEVWRRINKE